MKAMKAVLLASVITLVVGQNVHAAGVMNGMNLNGMALNGAYLNGWTLNGLFRNGLCRAGGVWEGCIQAGKSPVSGPEDQLRHHQANPFEGINKEALAKS